MKAMSILQQSLSASVIFVVFFTYFAMGAHFLPPKAGPDYGGSRAAVDFYLKEGRLATVPRDEGLMKFSIYGNSRLLRPPLGFTSAAVIAKLNNISVENGDERFYFYRLANSAFGALTLVVVFATLLLLFNSRYVAIFGVLLAGLLPQFAFTSMYLNDDSIAILSVSFIVFIMSWMVKNGVSTFNSVTFALAVGIIVISKKSAWIFLPVVILFYVVFVLRFERNFFRKHILMLIAFLIAGGWWLGFNMFHYGWNDPFLSAVGSEITERYSKVDLTKYGFQAKGVHIRQLLFDNYMNFIPATYMAFIGHLDWLTLRLGSVQYGFYLFLVLGLVINIPFLIAESIQTKFKDRKVHFEWLLYLAIGLQIIAYTWANVYRDIQIQGKYLLPVILPLLILGLSFYTKLFSNSQWSSGGFLYSILFLLILLAPIVVHLEALVNYVIPFYWPNVDIANLLNKIF